MERKFKRSELKNLMMLGIRQFLKVKSSYKKSFLKYHLIRRKYILSKACEKFEKNKFEPAPLLGKKFLDVGCGFNQISDELAFRGADILAIDSDLEMLTKAKNNAHNTGSPVNYVNVDFKNLDESKKFDVILFLDYLNKDNLSESIAKAKRHLNENGAVIISGSHKTFKSFLRNILIPRIFYKMLNLNIRMKDLINIRTVLKELRQNGFVVEDLQGIDFAFTKGKWYKSESTNVRYVIYSST